MWTQWLERTLRKRPQKIAAVARRQPNSDCHCEEPNAPKQSPEDCFAALAMTAEEGGADR